VKVKMRQPHSHSGRRIQGVLGGGDGGGLGGGLGGLGGGGLGGCRTHATIQAI